MESKNYEQKAKARYSAEDKTETSKQLVKQSGCCSKNYSLQDINRQLGYSSDQINLLPENVNLGMGCGNPLAFAPIQSGNTVLDLGSSGGLDCFLASPLVGETGKVIGVDFTHEIIIVD